MTPVALSIAGSDASGGAGIQADLKTFHQFGVYGTSAITLITVQNTTGVERVQCLAPDLVAQQILAVSGDIPPRAAKTGALGNREIVETIADLAADFAFPLVVDPVVVSKNGAVLLTPDALDAFKLKLLPRAFLITPNLDEAGLLTGVDVGDTNAMRTAAKVLASMGPEAVLVKGGHLRGDATDILLYRDEWFEFSAPRIQTRHTHGTGCTYAAAITALLACDNDLVTAMRKAKAFISEAICTAPGLGRGCGPVNHGAVSKSD